jgi:6-phosphofructokinase 2
MIATVTMNPCLDKTITVHGLRLDEANRWTSVRRDPGGKGIGVSRAIHEMGGETIIYGFIGGSDGRVVEILLDREGVPCDFTPIEGETRTNFIVTDTKTHRQTRLDAPGPSISDDELRRLGRRLDGLSSALDFIVFSGSVPPGVPAGIYRNWIEAAKGKGIRTALDADGKWLREGIKAKPYIIKPNVHEAEMLLGMELATEEAVAEAARRLVKEGIQVVVISRGKDGLIAAGGGEILKVESPEVEVKSSVGAGDCTLAGLVMELARGKPLAEACQLGAAMGTAAVLTPATELCHRSDVERLLPQVKVSRINSDAD